MIPSLKPTILCQRPLHEITDFSQWFGSEFLLNCAYDGLAPLRRCFADPWVERWAMAWIQTRLPSPNFGIEQQWQAADRAASCFQIFGLHLALPTRITMKTSWRCSTRKEGNWLLFAINDEPICAKWNAHTEVSGEDTKRLPLEILGISFAGTGISNSPNLKMFSALQCVSFFNCGRLQDFGELRGLTSLSGLTLSGALTLEDFSPLCDLPALELLGGAFMNHAPDAVHLQSLPLLRVLDLEANRGIRNLGFLQATPALESLAIRGTRIGRVVGLEPVQMPLGLRSLSADSFSSEIARELLKEERFDNYLIKTFDQGTLTNLEA